MKTLAQCRPGMRVKVLKLHCSGALKRRIMDMGVLKGTEIQICREAPLKDPLEIKVRGYDLTLRRVDAETIEVEES